MNAMIRYMILTGTVVFPGLTYAYIGPGTGLSAIGSLVAFIGAVLLLIVGFVWFPIKRLLKFKKTQTPPPTETQTNDTIKLDSKQHDNES